MNHDGLYTLAGALQQCIYSDTPSFGSPCSLPGLAFDDSPCSYANHDASARFDVFFFFFLTALELISEHTLFSAFGPATRTCITGICHDGGCPIRISPKWRVYMEMWHASCVSSESPLQVHLCSIALSPRRLFCGSSKLRAAGRTFCCV